MYAVVAVNTPAHGGGTAYRPTGHIDSEAQFPGPVFHYDLPSHLAGQIAPGHLVEAPFGRRRVQAIVVELSNTAPVEKTRPLESVLLNEPVLSDRQIALGCWLSETTCSSLIDCFRLMLPPGLLRQPRTAISLHPQASIPADLPSSQGRVAALLQSEGPLTPTQIAYRIRGHDVQSAIRGLVRRGIAIRGSDLPEPSARPKRANFCRLIASPPQVAAARPTLGRSHLQANVLQTLLGTDQPPPSVERVCTLSGASRATLRTMEKKGWIQVDAGNILLAPGPDAEDVSLDRAPRQKAVLSILQDRPPVERRALQQESGASSATIRTMITRGLLQQIEMPSSVRLRQLPGQAQDQIIELRRSRQQHTILDYLLAQPSNQWIWVSWVYAETGCSLSDLRALQDAGLIELAERQVWRDPVADQEFVLQSAPRLTPDQQRVWDAIRLAIEGTASSPLTTDAHCPWLADLRQKPPACFLLHGVTGSGKTEIYMRAVAETLDQGRQAIVLVPEISLTPQTLRRFAARFPDGLGILHSGLSDGERYDTWRRIRRGDIHLVIGPRSALFAPFDNIGLIVLDEEHSASFKETDRMPAYHARHVAAYIASASNAILILGSATPDLTTAYCATETRAVQLVELPQRILEHRRRLHEQQSQHNLPRVHYQPLEGDLADVYSIPLPPVRIVDMRHELRAGNRSMFSRALQKEIASALERREQIILFLNRRGASTFVMCRDCGAVIRCPQCDIPLTYHLQGKALTCHHCGYQRAVPTQCPICASHMIKHFGVGTQRVEQAVRQTFPHARVLRWDSDTTTEKGSHGELLDQFSKHNADILIGTQMVAKGLDLPMVTLVGVISADTALHLPDFRAAERTFQLLAQVAGRAGRGPRGGRVIIQTYTPEHYAIQCASRHSYRDFYRQERRYRRELGYPPFSRLAQLVYSDANNERCRQAAADLATELEEHLHREPEARISLIGPAPCFLSRLRGRWRWQIILREEPPGTALRRLLSHISLSPGWHLDIDPLNML